MNEKYNHWNALYHYNLDCVLRSEETNEKLGEFQAREYAEREQSAGFIGGGIASTGQSYRIATLSDVIKRAEEYSCIVEVEGLKYRLVSRKVRILTPFRGYAHIPKQLEYILELA